jgi:eukaryotic-like serine/threonine-protein kinase
MCESSATEIVFSAALEKATPEDRAAYLDQACAGDDELRRRVQRLLATHASVGQFLERPVVEAEGVAALAAAESSAADLSFLLPSSEPDSLGRLDHYEVLEVVGRGGTGVVLRAHDTKLRRIVAVKVLAAPPAVTGTARERFVREARAAAAVRDDHVVAIHAVCDEGPVPYLVMEFIDGCNLEALLRRGGPLAVKEVLRIGIQVASGLAAAHQQGLIHRDVKPANILLENGVQRVKLTDFGLARAADDASLTQNNLIAGTPLYMAPEQAAGEPLGARSDLFSLGSVLYEMCTGRPAFRATTTVAVIKRVCDETPRPIHELSPDVPEPICRLIERLQAKKPADRPASAREVADLLSDMLAQGAAAPSPGAAPTALPRPKAMTHPWLWAAAALVMLFTGLGLSEASGVTDVRATVIRLLVAEGTLVVEVDDPAVSVAIDGTEVVITGAGVREVRLKPGAYNVRASKQGQLVRSELISISRNGREIVTIRQETGPSAAALAWEETVARLPAKTQAREVERRLRELNPEFRGMVGSLIKDGVVWQVGFLTDRITDLSPLRALKGLTSIDCSGSYPRKGRLFDLSPLSGLRLIRVNCADTQVSDLEPLRGMPLEYLHCPQTGVTSLSPLEGMKLRWLTAQNTPLFDLRPLSGMPLIYLDLAGTNGVTDLTPLDQMPLTYLNLSELKISEIGRFESIHTLRALFLDDTLVADLAPLRNLRLERLSIRNTAATDLSPIAKMPLTHLRLDYRRELEPLLRSLKKLEYINDMPRDVFWKGLAGKKP